MNRLDFIKFQVKDRKKYPWRRFFYFLICMMLLSQSISFSYSASNKYILVLNSYHEGLDWSDRIMDGIQSVLRNSKGNIDMRIEYMDMKRILEDRYSDDEYFAKLYDLYKFKFSNKKFDAIIATDDNAYAFLLKYQKELFPNVPVIFCGVENFDDTMLPKNNLFSGIVETIDIKPTLNMALKLHPQTKQIVVINDQTAPGRFFEKEFEKTIHDFEDSIKITLLNLNNLTPEELQTKIQNLHKDSIILALSFYKDKAGNVLDTKKALSLVSQNTNVPVYALCDIHLGFGAVGGVVRSSFSMGKTAAKVTLQILEGEKVSNIPIIKKQPLYYMFDYKQLQHFGIKTSDLPRESILINKPSSFYSISKKFVWYGALALIILFIIILFYLLATISKRKEIEKRKETEENLRESEERYKRLVELSPDGIFLIKENKICFANPAGIKLFGADTGNDIIGKSITDFEDIADHEKIRERFRIANGGENPSQFIEQKIRKLDGSTVDVEAAGVLFPNEENPILLAVVRDITERKLLNEALQYDKIKNEFFANLSHELRTPLNMLFTTLQLLDVSLKSSVEDKENDIAKYIKMMRQNCYRLLRLLNNLIDITKIDSGFFEVKLENHNIINIVEEITLSVVQYAESRSLTLMFDTEIEEKMIACDPDQIERIVLNLLSNAIKFTNPGGSIFVNIYDKEDKIWISVKDTGVGIEPEKQKIIFERFRQVDKSFTRNHEGSGVGLSLIKSLIEMQGGSVFVKSQYNKGSEFIIELPISAVEENTEPLNKNGRNDHVQRMNIEFSDIYC